MKFEVSEVRKRFGKGPKRSKTVQKVLVIWFKRTKSYSQKIPMSPLAPKLIKCVFKFLFRYIEPSNSNLYFGPIVLPTVP